MFSPEIPLVKARSPRASFFAGKPSLLACFALSGFICTACIAAACSNRKHGHRLMLVGFAKLQKTIAQSIGSPQHRSQPPLTNFEHAAALAQLGSLDEARVAAKAGISLCVTIRRFRQTSNDNPVLLAKRKRIIRGMLMAGVPEG
ncbi:hypothetical protein V1283_005124 [Bradyrhizobium sp. AZCC 2262]|uniref:hypothetical protein n=1 Tax=Bradyrhizobium sp. AZCC 2262 TaxID=3117022 RepID=UPI002FF1B91B